ncbi:MAG: ferredoxin-thioredoxin reductase catalytic domain-containing protein [Candidatus Aminicenantales bacterium]
MKKFWRCFVCNDIHYGLKPPEICPTCSVKNAYIEISSKEARKMMRASKRTLTREGFRKAIEKFAEKNEFEVNPDTEKVEMLLDGLHANEKNYGLKYCPCRLASGDYAEDLKLVCPCNFLVHETYRDNEAGECWCGLFIKRKP